MPASPAGAELALPRRTDTSRARRAKSVMIEAVTSCCRPSLPARSSCGCSVPVPGPVVGLVLWPSSWSLAAFQRRSRNRPRALRNLSLLFVPAGVGIIPPGDVDCGDWLALSVGLIVSTFATLSVTALIFQWAQRRFGGAHERTPADEGGHRPLGLSRRRAPVLADPDARRLCYRRQARPGV